MGKIDEYIPDDLCEEIMTQAGKNEHFSEVYRVAKWGKIEERALLSTYGEIKMGYIEDNDEKYPKNEVGTYSVSVYSDRTSCDKFIKLLKRGRRLRTLFPYPIVIKGRTSNGFVQRTKDRDVSYADSTHIDWWLFEGKRKDVLQDFECCDKEVAQ